MTEDDIWKIHTGKGITFLSLVPLTFYERIVKGENKVDFQVGELWKIETGRDWLLSFVKWKRGKMEAGTPVYRKRTQCTLAHVKHGWHPEHTLKKLEGLHT